MILGNPQRFPFTPHHAMTLVVASDLKTRQIVWVRTGKVNAADAYVWAALGRQNRL